MTKYRIRLKNGRVIGPFEMNQIYDLKAKGHIVGNEDAQVFPLGDWKPMTAFDFYADLMDENRTIIQPRNEDSTFVIDLSQIRQKRNEKEIDKILVDQQGPAEQLTETMRLTPTKVSGEIEKLKNSAPPSRGNTAITISQEIQLPPEVDEREDKTLINPVAQEEIQKMRRQQADAERAEREKEEAIKREAAAYKERSRTNQALVVSSDDATQVISLGNKTELLSMAQVEELAIDKEIQDYIQKQKDEEESEEDEEAVDEEAEEEAKKAKRKKFIMIAAVMALLYVVLFPDDEKPEKPPFRHLAPQIVFAVPFDKKDTKKSQDLYTLGMKSYLLNTYPHLVNAGGYFRQSVENDYDNLLSYSMMVRAYGEELKFSKKRLEDANNLFKIIQVKKQYLIHNPDAVVGMNLFFMGIEKPEAAADVVKKYLRLYPKKVTQDLFAAYLQSLIKIGRVDEAKNFFQALEKQKDKSKFALESMIEYLRLNQEDDKAMVLIDEGMKRFPNSNNFYLLKCDLLLRKRELKMIPALLSVVEKRVIEYNDLYRAKFLEISGLYWAIKGDPKRATGFLALSLQINDSNELRVKLADLEATGASKTTDAIIGQSKAAKYLIEARDFYLKKNYAIAMSSAAKATDAYPGHIPSELFLAKMQMKLGLASESLKTLEKLAEKYPKNKDINLALIDAYTESYKFNNARSRIAILSGTEVRGTWEYASVNARLYLKMGDVLKAISWLKSSINANPLNDNDISQLAEIFLKRKNFDQARNLLNNAMELDPVKPEYRIQYARLLYEVEDDQAAVGYLLGLEKDFGENPKILGEIASLYYKSGKIKDFQDYKNKLEKLPTRDKALYEFLIKAAILDERFDEIPKLVEELLKIEPGDLEAMMTAGKVLFENDKYSESARWFIRLWQRMPTYPKVLYYIARIKYIAGIIDDPLLPDGKPELDEYGKPKLGALSLVKNDIKENGESDIALVFLGEIFVKKGDLVQAENHFKKAQRLNPKSYEALIGLADISTRRNNFDLALDLYKKAMKQRGEEPVIHRKIGDVYRLLGQGSLAIESYKMYLEMDPEASDKAQIEKYINLMQ
jgi:tetratricopeptide (TPR) repeat protein